MGLMVQCAAGRERDLERESRERRRYSFLEQLYLLTGEHCEHPVSASELEAELDLTAATPIEEIDDLVRLGYVRYAGSVGEICITEKGLQYLQRDAWRRRSIRD